MRYWGGALSQLGRLEESFRPLRESIAVCPSYATAYSALAWALVLNGQFQDALTAEETTERLRPRDPSVHVCMMSRAVAKYALGDYVDAEAVSRQSININEDFWLSNLILVAALGQQGRGAESEEARHKFADLLPGLTEERLAEFMPFKARDHLAHIIKGLSQANMRLA